MLQLQLTQAVSRQQQQHWQTAAVQTRSKRPQLEAQQQQQLAVAQL
jgi:hypothetical protein